MDYSAAVNSHYGRTGLLNSILAALESAGRNLGSLTTDDLAPLEEFHIGGRKSTLELAERAGISTPCRVLDIGCGIGGPARTLAHTFGCRVDGIDLTEEFCNVGRILTELTGLNDLVTIRNANALEIPAEDESFDVVWMQHVSMNIDHKHELAAEIARVTRLGGKLAIYEVVSSEQEIAHYPVPWASTAELNLLSSADDLECHFVSHGFRAKEWTDDTEAATARFRGAVRALTRGNPPPLSLVNLMGDRFPVMAKNLLQNLEEGRAAVVRGVLVLVT